MILTVFGTVGNTVALIIAVVVSVGMYLPAPGTDNINMVAVNGNRVNVPISFSVHEGAGINGVGLASALNGQQFQLVQGMKHHNRVFGALPFPDILSKSANCQWVNLLSALSLCPSESNILYFFPLSKKFLKIYFRYITRLKIGGSKGQRDNLIF